VSLKRDVVEFLGYEKRILKSNEIDYTSRPSMAQLVQRPRLPQKEQTAEQTCV
jgi:hypothetical protein